MKRRDFLKIAAATSVAITSLSVAEVVPREKIPRKSDQLASGWVDNKKTKPELVLFHDYDAMITFLNPSGEEMGSAECLTSGNKAHFGIMDLNINILGDGVYITKTGIIDMIRLDTCYGEIVFPADDLDWEVHPTVLKGDLVRFKDMEISINAL